MRSDGIKLHSHSLQPYLLSSPGQVANLEPVASVQLQHGEQQLAAQALLAAAGFAAC